MRVAYFGGSFDPVHLGHLAMAQDVLDKADLDEVVFLPAAQSPFKAHEHASADVRLACLRRTLADHEAFRIDDRELEREGPSYTVTTLAEIRDERPQDELFFLIGDDNLSGLGGWKGIDQLAEMTTFLVASRHGPKGTPSFPEGIKIQYVATRNHPASSRRIREVLASGRFPGGWLHPHVVSYIAEHQLYGFK